MHTPSTPRTTMNFPAQPMAAAGLAFSLLLGCFGCQSDGSATAADAEEQARSAVEQAPDTALEPTDMAAPAKDTTEQAPKAPAPSTEPGADGETTKDDLGAVNLDQDRPSPAPEQNAAKQEASTTTKKKKTAAQTPVTTPQKPATTAPAAESKELATAEPTKPASPAPAPPAAAEPCGEKGQPMCPMQKYMELKLESAMDNEDFAALAKELKRTAGMAPTPAWNSAAQSWSAISMQGQEAALAGDLAGVRQSCKSCHKAYRKPYRADYRLLPVP